MFKYKHTSQTTHRNPPTLEQNLCQSNSRDSLCDKKPCRHLASTSTNKPLLLLSHVTMSPAKCKGTSAEGATWREPAKHPPPPPSLPTLPPSLKLSGAARFGRRGREPNRTEPSRAAFWFGQLGNIPELDAFGTKPSCGPTGFLKRAFWDAIGRGRGPVFIKIDALI